MLNLLRQRNFGLLWFAGLISFTGDWFTLIALPVFIYNLTGSVLATGAMWMSSMLPQVLLGSVAGVYVDRWDRRVTMIVANFFTVPLMLVLLLVHTPGQLWMVYGAGLLKSVVGNFMGPAEHALLPKLVGEEHLVEANALNTLNGNLARLVGPALAGAVFAAFGFAYAISVDAASFGIAALMISLIRAPRSVTRAEHHLTPEGEAPAAAPNVLHELMEGLRLVLHDRLIGALFIFMSVAMLGEGFFEVLIIPYVKDSLHGTAQELGWLFTAQACGGLVGGIFIGRLSKRFKPAALIGPGLFFLGAMDAAVFNVPILQVDLLLFLLVGPPVIALQTGIQTLLQTNVADRYMGRVFGAFGTVVSLAILLGQGIASLFGGVLGPSLLMAVGGFLASAMGVFAFTMLSRLTPQHVTAQIGSEG